MKKQSTQLGLSVPVLVGIIHAFPTVSKRRRCPSERQAGNERVAHLMLNRGRKGTGLEKGFAVA